MASVEDIRLRENYLSWDKCREDTLVVKPELRDWERTNYQMDLRYVEWMMDHKPGDANKPVVIRACVSNMKIWHLKWRFLTVLVDGLTKRIKNKISEIQLCDSTLPVWFAYWCYLDYIPPNVKRKIVWKD